MKTKRKPKTYNRRGWWPDFWTVEKHPDGKWGVKCGNRWLVTCCNTECDAVMWADANAREGNR